MTLLAGVGWAGGVRAGDEGGDRPLAAALLPLPPGAVEPQGWLRDWAVSMRDGMTGHLDEYDPVFQLGWQGQRIGTTGEGAPGEGWPLEQSAYWIDGAVRLGHILHDDALLARVLPRLERIADAEQGNGSYLWWRAKFSWEGRDGPPVEGFDLWSCAVLGRALVAQYEATGERKWLACIERFFGNMPAEALFPITRSTVNLETLHEADRLGADRRIWNGVVDEARRMRREDSEWSHEKYWSAMSPKHATHGVTYNELAKLPLLLYAGTGEESFRKATRDRYRDLFEKHVLPFGVNSASERLGGIGATAATESCNVSDLIWSHLWLLRLLGDAGDADRIETAFFNAAPACVSRDCRRHVYYQSPNRPVSKSGPKGPGHPTNADFAKTQKPLCCTGNIPRIVPNYIIHMWMATPDRGLAATLYGPCRVRAKVADDVDVRLATTTDYPFGEDLVLAVSPAKPVRFPLYFRVPGWCVNPSFKVNGAEVRNEGGRDGFFRIERTWSEGDAVAIQFPMPPRVVKGRESGGAPYACVYAGPLLFARGVPEKSENEPAGADWRYALDFESERATDQMTIRRTPMPARWDWPFAAPVTLSVPAQGIGWESGKGDEGGLPAGPVEGRAGGMIDLIPYGCAKFRISMFPVTSKAWGDEK